MIASDDCSTACARRASPGLICSSLRRSSSSRISVAGELDVADRVDLAFVDARGEVHLALVGADRDLGRVDVEVDVAAVQVVRVELFQIAGELLARVLVVLGVPATASSMCSIRSRR